MKHGIEAVDVGGFGGNKLARGRVAWRPAERNDLPSASARHFRGASTDESRGSGDPEAHQLNFRCSQR
jgi:hypothetical protein